MAQRNLWGELLQSRRMSLRAVLRAAGISDRMIAEDLGLNEQMVCRTVQDPDGFQKLVSAQNAVLVLRAVARRLQIRPEQIPGYRARETVAADAAATGT